MGFHSGWNYQVVWLWRNVKVNYELAELVILTSTSSSDCNMNSLEASLFFCSHHVACGISVPWPRIEHGPRQWKHQILTTRPRGVPRSQLNKTGSLSNSIKDLRNKPVKKSCLGFIFNSATLGTKINFCTLPGWSQGARRTGHRLLMLEMSLP